MLFLRVLRILVLLFFEKGEDFRVHQRRRSLTAENVDDYNLVSISLLTSGAEGDFR